MRTHVGLVLTALLQSTVALATITFIGEGDIPGTATDQSGLTGILEDPTCVTAATFSSSPTTTISLSTQPNRFFAFAIDRTDLPGFQAQSFDRFSRKCFVRGR